MLCADKTLDYLRQWGFNVIRFPRANVRPLQVFAEERRELVWMGELEKVFVPGPTVELPKAQPGAGKMKVSGRQTNAIDARLGLSLLGSVIGAMGGSDVGLDLHYKQARTVVFQFGAVNEQRIAPAELDQYLADAELSAPAPTIARLLDAEDIYVTTSVLTAKSLTVHVEKSRGGGGALEVPVIQELVGASVEVSAAAEGTNTLTYEGRVALAFGFQAVRLSYDEGAYQAFKNVRSDVIMRSTSKPSAPDNAYLSDGRFARLSFG